MTKIIRNVSPYLKHIVLDMKEKGKEEEKKEKKIGESKRV